MPRTKTKPKPTKKPIKKVTRKPPARVTKKPPVKKRKATRPKPKPVMTQCMGQGCNGKLTMYLKTDLYLTEGGSPRCEKCWHAEFPDKVVKPLTKKAVKAEGVAKLRWYVLQVEPYAESRVRRDVLRRAKIDNLKDQVVKVIFPKKFDEIVVPVKGEVVAEGEAESPRTCHLRAQKKCQELVGLRPQEVSDEGRGKYPGYTYSVFRSKGKETGREGNNWTWKVRTQPPGKVRKTAQVRKYPGYLIVNLYYTPEVETMLKRIRGSWGVLLRPISGSYRVQVKQSKNVAGRWNWRVRNVETKEIVKKGKARSEELAKDAGQQAKDRLEAFKPLPLKSKEAAEILIAQKALNQIAKDPKERDKPVVNVKSGDTVTITDGAYKGAKGLVVSVDKKTDPTTPEATVMVSLLGRHVEIKVPYYELSRVIG